MIDCEYYLNYKGPNLTLAQIWKHGEQKLDITEYIKEYYGHENNWQENYTLMMIFFPIKIININLRLSF